MRTLRWVLLGIFAAGIGVTLFLQRETTANLRGEIALLRDEQRELAALRTEHERLVAAQPAAAERARLRAERDALARLRAELETMKQRAARMEAEAARAPKKPAVSTLALAVGSNGDLSLGGKLLDSAGLKQRLSGLPKGTTVEIQFTVDPRTSNAERWADDTKAAIDRLVSLEKELGLKLNFRFEQRAPGSQ